MRPVAVETERRVGLQRNLRSKTEKSVRFGKRKESTEKRPSSGSAARSDRERAALEVE